MNPTPIKLPADNRLRVFRGGGSWGNGASIVRAACRYDSSPPLRSRDIGFRCAQRDCCQPLKDTP